MASDAPTHLADGPSTWQQALATPEGKILLAGAVVACLYLAGAMLARIWSAGLSNGLLSMTIANAVGGRAAGITVGYKQGLTSWLVMTANFVIEAILVLLFYPLFVLSYHKLLIIGPLRGAMARARRTAEAHQAQIMKYGIPGLFLFVWFPFWMTGPMVGCVIGFLIGLRPWVNIPVVLTGTALATVCWSLVLEKVTVRLIKLGPYVPFLFVALILFFAISVHIRHAISKHPDNSDPPDTDASDD